jgi:hypothetical protein
MINDRRVAVIESEQGRTSRQNLRMRAARDFARMSFFTSRERVIVPILITSQPSRTAKRLHRHSSWSECPNSAGNRPGSLWQSFCNYRPTAFATVRRAQAFLEGTSQHCEPISSPRLLRNPAAQEASERLASIVVNLRKANPSITEEDAMRRVLDKNPELANLFA